MATVAAVDLGATSGRVILGTVAHNELAVRPIARFPNTPVPTIDGLHWNMLELYRNILAGLGAAVRAEPGLISIGVDSWAVDYALLRGRRMLGNPYHYRDERTAAGVAAVHAAIDPAELYRRNGLQHLPINTLYQLAVDDLMGVDRMLLIPDLIGYWLTGRSVAERSNASTTGLLGVHSREWDAELIARLGLPRAIFVELIEAGTTIGPLLPEVVAEIGGGMSASVVAVGSHDTASAVVAVPAATDDFAYISCGTWGLVGVELDSPLLSEAGRAANFSNEGGVDGRVRYLHNVVGLWLLSESVREWERSGETIDLPSLLAQAAAVSTPMPIFEANDPRFLAPGDMPARIAEYFTERGVAAIVSRPEFVRTIIDSLAAAFADAVETASALSGKRVDVIHLVGGGSQNVLLCQLTANHSGLTVLAGPVEATAIGNILVQARAQGLVTGDLENLRALVAKAFVPLRYEPQATSGGVRSTGQ
jgi:rhamnulokinase